MDIMQQIRSKTTAEEFDYLFLLDCLASYKQPRDKITKLLKSEAIIRIKKGIYIFGEQYRQRPYSLEVLSNLIYGPSYVSFEYALAYYGLIPEAVMRMTCAAYKKNKNFKTPVGEFTYHHVHPKVFSLGIRQETIDPQTHFLIATKEKALADTLCHMKPFSSEKELSIYLEEGMRIDPESLFKLEADQIEEISAVYQNLNVKLLWKILKK